MKKYNFLFLFLLMAIQIQAQNISVKSFRLLENDLDARLNYPKPDQNGEKCAIIKVVTTEDGFTWDGGALGITTIVKKQAEYWLYVPRGAKRITISHSKLGLLRNYAYTIPIEESTVYEMVLVTGKVITTVQENEIESQWLIINTEPAGADVYINDLPAGKTPYQNELPIGKYTWRLQKELYLNESGFLELTDSVKQKMDIKFKPNYGTLNIVSEPEVNANVYINGMAIGKTTPCKVEQIPSGEKTIKLIKDLYEFIDKQVILTPESNQQLAFTAKPSFGTINISTTPESNAFVSLDGQSLNKTTPCSKEYVPLGEHTISVSLDMYETTSQNINLASGETKSITINMKPTFAGVSITTEPFADIYINGEKKANGNWQGRLNPGVYTFEAKLDKHTTATEKQTVNIGQPLEIKLNPTPRIGMLKVMTTPFEANISINGKNYGTTPTSIKDLLIGDYTVELSLSGYATAIEKTTITEGQTATVNATLANGREANISSTPSGVDLFIDNIKVGITPYKGYLAFGSHRLRIEQNNKKAEKTINILQNGGETNFPLAFVTKTFTETINGISFKMLAIKGGTFQMGNNNGNAHEKPVHSVTVSDFFIGETEVTQALWKAVMGVSNTLSNPSEWKGDNLPVEQISWNDVQEFINKLNSLTGKNYRLPTEAEWEYAAGGASTGSANSANNRTKWTSTNSESSLGSYAWYSGNSNIQTHPVGTKNPNGLGLFDMSGNVWEWCSDWKGAYSYDSQTNPQGPATGSYRVLRGGSWYCTAARCRIASRDGNAPDSSDNDTGFRLVSPK
jgi:formylglycine-generating enzyme required for sulfatase activity